MAASTHQLVKEILYALNTEASPDMINHQFTGLLMGAALATNHLHLCRELNTLMKREWIADPTVPAEYSPEKMAERLAQALKQKGMATNGTK